MRKGGPSRRRVSGLRHGTLRHDGQALSAEGPATLLNGAPAAAHGAQSLPMMSVLASHSSCIVGISAPSASPCSCGSRMRSCVPHNTAIGIDSVW